MKKLSMLVIFCLVPVLSSFAQNRATTIMRAEYGIGNSWADVTVRVRSMVRNYALNFRVDNNTLGIDPRPGQRKVLRLDVQDRNRKQQLTFKENDYVKLRGYSPFADFEILRAIYGAGNRTMDVTRRLNSQVQGDQLRLRVSNETMGGDPYRNQRKTLTVQYRYDGRPAQVSIAEGDFLNLPATNDRGGRDNRGGDYRGGYDDRGGYDNRGGNDNRGGYDNNNRGLHITRAQYGVGNRMVDVTRSLDSQVQRGQISLQVSNQTMGGDPAPGQVKSLTVWYTNDGRPDQVTITEGGYLNLGNSPGR